MKDNGFLESGSSGGSISPSPKLPKSLQFLLEDEEEEEEEEEEENNFLAELERYCGQRFDLQTKKEEVLVFWQKNKAIFPKLAKVAFFLFSIAATNNATERLFSQCKLTFSSNRTSLGIKRFEHLIVIQNNADLCSSLQPSFFTDTAKIEDDSHDDFNEIYESDDDF